MPRGSKNAFIKEGEFKCKCGREFTKSQSLYAHQSHCKVHLGSDKVDKIEEIRSSNRVSWNKGRNKNDPEYGDSIGRCSPDKIPIEDILSNRVPYQSNKLKYRLYEEGLKEWKCERCGNTHWLGDWIPLELHHKDGDNKNNELDNLEFLCPNCHSLTDNYRWKNRKDRLHKIK